MSITTRSINEFDDPKDVLLRHINNMPGIRYRELLRFTGCLMDPLPIILAYWKDLPKLGLIDKRKKEQLGIIQSIFQYKNLIFYDCSEMKFQDK
jgi:hypothetical protein